MTASTLAEEPRDGFPITDAAWHRANHESEMRYRSAVARDAIHAGIAARHSREAVERAERIAAARDFAATLRAFEATMRRISHLFGGFRG
jgi:hypothetical protein